MNERRIFLSPPFVGDDERRAVGEAFDSGYIAPCGPMVDEFERRIAALAGRRFAVAVSSGTAAIDLAMAELGVDASWTVVAPTLTFIATVGPASHRGAECVFVDSDATGNVSVAALREALAAESRRNRKLVVIGVDLYGRSADYRSIASLCDCFGAVFVSDSAEAVGARDAAGRPAGSAGAIAVYSFNGNKIVTTSGGGALLTDDESVAERARKRSQQSREAKAYYEHLEIGYNYRLSNVLAALGLAQLDRLDKILSIRAATCRWYRDHLAPGWSMLPEVAGENHWLSVALAPDESARDELIGRFGAANIESRPVWKPMHLQPVFASSRYYGDRVAEDLFRRGICLPSGTGLAAADFDRIAAVLDGIGGGAAR